MVIAATFFSASRTDLYAQATIRVPADQPTIQAGINAAQNGDTVLVSPGTYFENIDFKGKAITVISANGPAQTIIDGGSNGPVVVFHSNESRNSIIEGFTLQNGGKLLYPFDNTKTGGIYVDNAMPSIIGNTITHNVCQGIYSYMSGPLIQGNELSYTIDAGDKCSIAGGSAILLQGEYYASPTSNAVPSVAIGNTIENNTNSGTEDAGGNGGAGIADWAYQAIIEGNTIRNNTTYGNGGGINVVSSGPAIITQNLIYNNAAGCGGGGFALSFGTNQTIGPPTALVINNTIANNTTNRICGYDDQPNGSQVYIWQPLGENLFANNLIVGADANPAVFCDPTWADVGAKSIIFDHNDVFSPQGSRYGGVCSDQTGSYGNISADPQFVNPTGGDYHLKSGSPAIDTGNNSALQLLTNVGYGLTKDLDGNPRVQDGTGVGYPIVDMGAYEYSGTQETGSTTLLLTPSAYELSGGKGLTLSAKLVSPNGTPTGTVTFFEDGTQIGASTIDTTGLATWSVASVTPGVHALLATYSGQGSFTPATSVVIYVVVDKYGVTLTLASAPNPSLFGQSVAFNIKISAPDGVPSGTVTLSDGPTLLATLTPDSNGGATYSTSSLAVGTHFIQANYAGDASHLGATASVQQVVTNGNTTTASLISSLNPANAGQNVTFTATITSSSGTPTGSVTFTDGNTTLGAQALTNGVASFGTSTLAVGTHAITATYSPTGSFAPSSASMSETISGLPDTDTMSASPNPASVQQSVTLSATVTGVGQAPTGTVTFYDGPSAIGAAPLNASGVASVVTTFSSPGNHSLTANYSGDATYLSNTTTPITETILGPVGDFKLTASPGTNSIFAGAAAKYTLVATSINGFNQSIALSCSGLPAESTCAFAPAPIAGGAGSSVLVIQTTAPAAMTTAQSTGGLPLQGALAGLAILLLPVRLRRRGALLIALALVCFGTTIGCGAPKGQTGGTPPGVYSVTINATASQSGQTLVRATTVGLTVKSWSGN